ncbi:MAG TPA: LppX_LprAFG lipoprotein [Nocardioides sp.]|nr:LppX_LprAFG lipoprotein [Nocardioides sp.]
MRMRRLVVAATVSVLLVGSSACSGDDTTAVSDDATTESSAPEPSEPSETESESEEASEEPEPQDGGYDAKELLAAMKAAVEDNESAHLVMQMGGGGQTMDAEGDVSYAGDSTSMQLTMQAPQMGQGVIEVRLVDGVMYMAMPPMTPEGKFLQIDLDDPNSPLGSLGGVTQGDPLETFKAFDEGLRDVEYLGSEDVDGEEMDHYVLTVDGKAAAKAQGAPAGSVPDELSYDLWLDDQDLMRRVQYTMGGGGVTISMSDWGEPVRVKAPPRSAIMEMPNQ